MRVVLDLQAIQAESKFRGIGRYSQALALEMAKYSTQHDIVILLNGCFTESIRSIRNKFEQFVDRANIQVCVLPEVTAGWDTAQRWSRQCARNIRHQFLKTLAPDIVFIFSFFEGYGDSAIHSIQGNETWLTAVVLYDLIPYIQADKYLTTASYKAFYLDLLAQYKYADIFLAISASSKNEAITYLNVEENKIVNILGAADACFNTVPLSNTNKTAFLKKYNITKPFILYAGPSDERKNLPALISAYAQLPKAVRVAHQLVFVGGMPHEHQVLLRNTAQRLGVESKEFIITGRVDDSDLLSAYKLCKLFVFPSMHEGFGLPVLEAMSCGAAVIASNATSIPEIVGENGILFNPANVNEIVLKITEVLSNESVRQQLIENSIARAQLFSWERSAKLAMVALEDGHARFKATAEQRVAHNAAPAAEISPSAAVDALLKQLMPLIPATASNNYLLNLARSVDVAVPRENSQRFLFVDVSELVVRDARTGIQRVTRAILTELLNNPPLGFVVAPVYAVDQVQGYKYATDFKKAFDTSAANNADEIGAISFRAGDVFLGLDLQPQVVASQHAFYEILREHGVGVFFVVYDILLLQNPQWWPLGAAESFEKWLHTTASVANGLLCISEAVKHDVKCWLEQNNPSNTNSPLLASFHLGADVSESQPTKGLPNNFDVIAKKITQSPTFLTVGTLEPRKGHVQMLAAFEQLWSEGVDTNLVIVGKQGWMVDALLASIREHPRNGVNLFWLEGASDECLEQMYKMASCFVYASEGEGFGLPLIEAAQHSLPIIVRDLPVFKEVAGEHAFYFKGLNAIGLADAIKNWLALNAAGKAPQSSNMPWLTWKESSAQLINAMIMR